MHIKNEILQEPLSLRGGATGGELAPPLDGRGGPSNPRPLSDESEALFGNHCSTIGTILLGFDKIRRYKIFLESCSRLLSAVRARLMPIERHHWLGNIKAMCEIANLEMAVRFCPQPYSSYV